MRIVLILLTILCGSVLGSTMIEYFKPIVQDRNDILCEIDIDYCENEQPN